MRPAGFFPCYISGCTESVPLFGAKSLCIRRIRRGVNHEKYYFNRRPSDRQTAPRALCGIAEKTRGDAELRSVRRGQHSDRRRPGTDGQCGQSGKDPREHHQRGARLSVGRHRSRQSNDLCPVCTAGIARADLLLSQPCDHGALIPQSHGKIRDPDAWICRGGTAGRLLHLSRIPGSRHHCL